MTSDERPAPRVGQKFDLLRSLLREMFQLDRGDLDFGLYRIMNLKSEEITEFLDEDLLPRVKENIRMTSEEDLKLLEEKIKKFESQAFLMGFEPEASDKYKDLKKRYREALKDVEVEADVYNLLTNFFSRYYVEGDFISQRRYTSGGCSAYLIPYDGEEVKLHWANADQYYIKTTENYASYSFTVGSKADRRISFEIVKADNEKDNIKEANNKQRRFVLARDRRAVDISNGQLVVRFEHRPITAGEKKRWPGNSTTQQGRINRDTEKRILDKVDSDWHIPLTTLDPTDANEERTLLGKHIDRYTSKNSFDYFIHKDLQGFLSRELDMFLNSEVLKPADLEMGDASRLDRALARVRAVRRIGNNIIDFLAQLENFQKQLWLKKKFVLDTQWCVTLDRVPERLLPEIAANKAQCEEWVSLFAVDEIEGDTTNGNTTWSDPPSIAFLKANPYLIVDTGFFDNHFKQRLLAALSARGSLHRQLDGLLIHGENFQAINLLKAQYNSQIKAIYIDPPFNTNASAILYKNGYKDSSWMSLMENRLSLVQPLLQQRGIVCVAIDDTEISALRHMMARIYSTEMGVAAVCSNPRGRKTRGRLAPAHEYALFYSKDEDAVLAALPKVRNSSYPYEDRKGFFTWMSLVRTGTNSLRQDRPKLYYPIFVSESDEIRIPEMEWNESKGSWDILEEKYPDEYEIYPTRLSGNNIEGNWHRGHNKIIDAPEEYRVHRTRKGEIRIQFKARMDEGSPPLTWWGDSKYDSGNGTKRLTAMFGSKVFDFPKSVDLVKDCIITSTADDPEALIMDFFSGSGTTGHAVIDLNRAADMRLRYILVEVGDHFSKVLVPRIKKIIYSSKWKNGKPVSRQGMTAVFKRVKLESYEDTLDSLEVCSPSKDMKTLLKENTKTNEDYMLKHLLNSGRCFFNVEEFSDPFKYKIDVVQNGERSRSFVDLPETFNFLIGLNVESYQRIDDVLVITGIRATGERCLILWRNLNDIGYTELEDWFNSYRDKFAKDIDVIYVNGDHTLNAVRRPDESWRAESIEPIFEDSMFNTSGV